MHVPYQNDGLAQDTAARENGVGGIMVSIAAFQAVDPGSIPGRRRFVLLSSCLALLFVCFKACILASRREAATPGQPSERPYGAMVARLTPDQKVMCSNHIGVNKDSSFVCSSVADI